MRQGGPFSRLMQPSEVEEKKKKLSNKETQTTVSLPDFYGNEAKQNLKEVAFKIIIPLIRHDPNENPSKVAT